MEVGAVWVAALFVIAGPAAASAQPTPPDPLALSLHKISQSSHPNARCLDGTAPAYYFRPARNGERSLILFLQGGGWCYPDEIQQPCSPSSSHCTANCHIRANTSAGSSAHYPATVPHTAIEGGTGYLSGDPAKTAFADFAVAYANYCDGGSFSGTKTTPDVALNGTGPLYYAGKHNLDAIAADIVASAAAATESGGYDRIILSGCSAGGMACYLHCDYLAAYFKGVYPGIDFRCICDAGVFLDVPTVTGAGDVMRTRFFDLADKMDTKASLNPDCVAGPNRETDWRECMFSETALKHTTTPLFAMNSAYNFGEWEMLPPPTREDFPPDTTAAAADWAACWPGTGLLTPKTYAHCNATQKAIIAQHFGTFKAAMAPATDPASPHGAWLSACPGMHCQTGFDSSVLVGGLSVGDAAAQWYFNRSTTVKLVDVAFPGNPTCPSVKAQAAGYRRASGQ